jgi:hypothetical protein
MVSCCVELQDPLILKVVWILTSCCFPGRLDASWNVEVRAIREVEQGTIILEPFVQRGLSVLWVSVAGYYKRGTSLLEFSTALLSSSIGNVVGRLLVKVA